MVIKISATKKYRKMRSSKNSRFTIKSTNPMANDRTWESTVLLGKTLEKGPPHAGVGKCNKVNLGIFIPEAELQVDT